jgi:hypothetical protein
MWMLPCEDWGDYENAAPFEHLDYRRSCVVGAGSAPRADC